MTPEQAYNILRVSTAERWYVWLHGTVTPDAKLYVSPGAREWFETVEPSDDLLIEPYELACGLRLPEFVWGVSLYAAYRIHAVMYGAGQTATAKIIADRVLLNNCVRLVTAAHNTNQRLLARRLQKIAAIVALVYDFAGPDFWQDKCAASEWIEFKGALSCL